VISPGLRKLSGITLASIYPTVSRLREGRTDQMSIEEMRSVDIRTVQADQLADRRGIVIDQKLSRKERLCQYIRQVRNPYCYVDDGVIVKVSFSNTKETIEDRLEAYIRNM